jgi:hypothetical protein
MGLFSLMSSKRSLDSDMADPGVAKRSLSGVAPSQYDRGSKDRITAREMDPIKRRLIRSLGHRKAEEVMNGLSAHLDRDRNSAGKSVSAEEMETLMQTLEESHYNGMDKDDLDKTREILDGYK